jgi:hypothetical protein
MRIVTPLLTLGLSLTLCFTACAPRHSRILDTEESQSQVKLRQIQSRMFETSDKEKTLRSVIATLQDLNFVIDKADLDLGTVSATKLNGYSLRMTVTVRPRSAKQMIVRANAQYNNYPVTDPQPYQDFFVALGRAMFLAANSVD